MGPPPVSPAEQADATWNYEDLVDRARGEYNGSLEGDIRDVALQPGVEIVGRDRMLGDPGPFAEVDGCPELVSDLESGSVPSP
jgi:hypothetical protein